MNDSDPPKPKLRWYQFSLRTLFMFITLFAVACGWLSVKMQRARRQRETVQVIVEAGGLVIIYFALSLSLAQQAYANEVRLRLVELTDKPVIQKGSPGTEGNKYGFEGGSVIKIDATYHLFTAEMVGDPFWIKLKLAHWTSPDGLTWTRQSTIDDGSGDFTGEDPRSNLWAPMPIFNEAKDRWELFYVAYHSGGKGKTSHWDGRIWRAESTTPGRKGIGGPWSDRGIVLEPGSDSQPWEGVQGTDSFYPFHNGKKWIGLYGSSPCGRPWQVGLAEADSLAGPWRRLSGNPALNGYGDIENPIVTKTADGLFVAVYDQISPSDVIGYIVSEDGITWSKPKQLRIQSTTCGDIRTPLGLVREPDGTFTVFFTGRAAKDRYWPLWRMRVQMDQPPGAHEN